MKFRTLVIGYSLALALFLFAQHRPGVPQAGAFHSVVDLTRSIDLATSGYHIARRSSRSMFLPVSAVQPVSKRRAATARMQSATRIIAPSQVAPTLWNVDQIPAGKLVAPLVILDVAAQMNHQSGYVVSVEDIAQWEHINGEIPLGAVVVARTGWSPTDRNIPGFSQDAVLFLVEGRKVLGLGSDAPSFENESTSTDRYALSHSVYYLENVTNLDRVPDHGAVVVVAPTKVEGRSSAPVRVMALVQ
jgi:kynurenine formamidase